MGKLTDRQIQAFTYPKDRGRHSDGMGLFLDVRNGIKVWIRRYRWKKPSGEWSEKVITIGHYPQAGWKARHPVGLAEARKKNAEIRDLAGEQRPPAVFFRRLWEKTEDWHGKNHNQRRTGRPDGARRDQVRAKTPDHVREPSTPGNAGATGD